VDAAPHADPAVIKSILAAQLTAPVQWETTLKTLLDKGLQRSYEIGPNKARRGWVAAAVGLCPAWFGSQAAVIPLLCGR
jgi:[acyl-carrier-protein] S-malonyltransferase